MKTFSFFILLGCELEVLELDLLFCGLRGCSVCLGNYIWGLIFLILSEELGHYVFWAASSDYQGYFAFLGKEKGFGSLCLLFFTSKKLSYAGKGRIYFLLSSL